MELCKICPISLYCICWNKEPVSPQQVTPEVRGSLWVSQGEGLGHPEQMSLSNTAHGKREGVSSPETGILVQASTEKGLRMGKGIKSESPVWKTAVLVLILAGLGLTRLSQKLFENSSVCIWPLGRASGRDQAALSEPIPFSAQLQGCLVCRQGRAGPLLQWHLWHRHNPAGKRVAWPGQQHWQMARIFHLSRSCRALSGGGEARHLLFQSHSALCRQRDDPRAANPLPRALPPRLWLLRPWQELCRSVAAGGPHWGLKLLHLVRRNHGKD